MIGRGRRMLRRRRKQSELKTQKEAQLRQRNKPSFISLSPSHQGENNRDSSKGWEDFTAAVNATPDNITPRKDNWSRKRSAGKARDTQSNATNDDRSNSNIHNDDSVSGDASSRSASMSTLLSESSSDDSSTSSSILASLDGKDDDNDFFNNSLDSGGDDNDNDMDSSLSKANARMKRTFAERDAMLDEIAAEGDGERHRAYVEYLRQNDMEVRAEMKRMLDVRRERRRRRRNQKPKTGDAPKKETGDISGNSATDKNKSRDDDTPLPSESVSNYHRRPSSSIVRLLQFEAYHTMPGCATFVLYCLCHLSVYELISNIFLETVKYVENQQLVYIATFIISLIMSRLTGDLWSWLPPHLYSGVKFDIHNRLRKGNVDARIHRWFRRHSSIKCAVDVVSVYLCFLTLSYFVQDRIIPSMLNVRDDIVAGLPSLTLTEDFCKTKMRKILSGDLSDSCSNIDLRRYRNRMACFDENNVIVEGGPYCYNSTDLATALISEDEEYVFSQVSVSSFYSVTGSGHAALIRPKSIIAFFASISALSIAALFQFDFHFWEGS